MFHTVLLPKICCDFCTFILYGVSVLGFLVTIGASCSVLLNDYKGSELIIRYIKDGDIKRLGPWFDIEQHNHATVNLDIKKTSQCYVLDPQAAFTCHTAALQIIPGHCPHF